LTLQNAERLSVIFCWGAKIEFYNLAVPIHTAMGNKRIIISNGKWRKVCQRTQKVVLETNFCWCGNKHCHEGFRMNSEKALCKVRRFREKFSHLNYKKIEFDDAEITDE
jgi:hypothetical protein